MLVQSCWEQAASVQADTANDPTLWKSDPQRQLQRPVLAAAERTTRPKRHIASRRTVARMAAVEMTV